MIKRYKQNEIDKLVEILINDGVISVPTDTVYGVCARINSKKAYDKLVKVKNRPGNKMFPVMCADEEQIRSIAMIDKKAEKIIKEFMPGPITIVLNSIDGKINNGYDEYKTVAVRMATSKELKELIKRIGSPLFMSSANQSGEPICKNLDEIEKLCPLIDGMLEGDIVYGKGSTIVDCTSEEIKIIREGPITKEQILSIFD